MYTLFGGKFTRATGPQMVLEETGVDYDIHYVDIVNDEHRKPAFLAINPAGYVPALRTPDGHVLHEAAAIMLYLADQHGLGTLIPEMDSPERGVFYSKYFFLTNDIQPSMKRYYYPERYSSDPGDAPRIKTQAYDMAMERWGVVERHLAASGPFHLGENISIADFYMAVWAAFGFEGDYNLLEDHPAVRLCYQMVRERPLIKPLLKEIEGVIDEYLLAKSNNQETV